MISLMTIGPINGAELEAPTPVRNSASEDGLSAPKVRWRAAGYSTPWWSSSARTTRHLARGRTRRLCENQSNCRSYPPATARSLRPLRGPKRRACPDYWNKTDTDKSQEIHSGAQSRHWLADIF